MHSALEVSDYHFPEFPGDVHFDAVMCSDEGDIYLKEVGTGVVWYVEEGMFREALAELPKGWNIGIMMPDGSVAKITPNN